MVEFDFGSEGRLQKRDAVYQQWANHMMALVQAQPERFSLDPIRAIGVAFPGTVDMENQVLVRGDNLSVNSGVAWENVDLNTTFVPVLKSTFNKAGLKNVIADELQITAANDLVVGMLGERVYGSGRNFENGVLRLVQLGTGYGGATIVAGKHGDVLIPGEPGQVVYQIGRDKKQKRVEDFVGHASLKAQSAKLNMGPDADGLSPKKITRQAFDQSASKKERRKAMGIIEAAMDKLALSLAHTIQEFNTSKLIVVGGGFPLNIEKAGGEGTLLKLLNKALKKRCRDSELENTELRLASFDNNLVGASVLADLRRYSETNPLTILP